MKPGAVVAAALAVLLALGLAFGAGWLFRGWAVAASQAKAVQSKAKADTQQAERASSAVQATAEAKTQTEIRYVTVTKTVEKLVERPVYLQQCFDDDGLRAINAQILGFDSSESESAVP